MDQYAFIFQRYTPLQHYRVEREQDCIRGWYPRSSCPFRGDVVFVYTMPCTCEHSLVQVCWSQESQGGLPRGEAGQNLRRVIDVSFLRALQSMLRGATSEMAVAGLHRAAPGGIQRADIALLRRVCPVAIAFFLPMDCSPTCNERKIPPSRALRRCMEALAGSKRFPDRGALTRVGR